MCSLGKIILVTKGTYGDIVPFLALGRALKDRGNQVVLITNAHYASEAAKAELEFDSWDSGSEYEAFVKDGPLLDVPWGIRDFADKHIFPQFEREYNVLTKHLQTAEMPLIIARHMGSIAAQLVSERDGIPLLSVFTAAVQVECIPLLACLYESQLAEKINSCRTGIGLRAVSNWKEWILKSVGFLACWPAWFALPSPEWPSNLTNIGFVMSDESGPLPAEVQTLIKLGNPLVLVTGGTAIWTHAESFYETVSRACGLIECQAIVVCRHQQLLPISVPQNVHKFAFLPFASLMPYVAAVVHHGGASVLVRALASAVPQIILPYGGDRPDNAARLQKFGLGFKMPISNWTADAIAQKINDVITSPTVSRACGRLQDHFLRSTDLADACKVIEKYLVP